MHVHVIKQYTPDYMHMYALQHITDLFTSYVSDNLSPSRRVVVSR